MSTILNTFSLHFHGNPLLRANPCSICNETHAVQIGLADYWDLKSCSIVQCPSCKHIQLDPMLDFDDTAKGCYAYYIEELLRTNEKELFANCVRNFRRGVLFAYSLKNRNYYPARILELGPGSGYFADGIKFVFPDVVIDVMDINSDVLEFNLSHHGFKGIRSVPDSYVESCNGIYDLVIARDILEHVSNISMVISNVVTYLKPGGLFQFTTPVGYEDVYKHYLAFQKLHQKTELLINHVNYFEGASLKNLLIQNNLIPLEYYSFKLKTSIRRYIRSDKKLMAPLSKKKSADEYVNNLSGKVANVSYDKKTILGKWYIKPNAGWITFLYSFYQHYSFFRINPESNLGHEIYGLFKKNE